MGFGEGKQAITRWRVAEVEVLNKICLEHGIQPLAPEKARGTVEIPEYKEQRRQNDELKIQNVQAEAELSEKRSESEKLDQQIEEKSAQVKAILNYIPDYEKEFQVEDECEQICRELTSLLDGKLSIMKHSDEIISKAQRLSKNMKKLRDSTHKPHDTRHTCISMMTEKEVSPTLIKKIVGHSCAMSLTEKVYTHVNVQELLDAINKI